MGMRGGGGFITCRPMLDSEGSMFLCSVEIPCFFSILGGGGLGVSTFCSSHGFESKVNRSSLGVESGSLCGGKSEGAKPMFF